MSPIRATQRKSRPKAKAAKPRSTRSSASARAASAARDVARKVAAAAKAAAATPPKALELSERQRRFLKGLAHSLKPLIRVGNSGLTDAVAAETARALHDHELIKVKAPGGDRDARDAAFEQLATRTSSALVQRIGNIAVLYRPRPEMARIVIPD